MDRRLFDAPLSEGRPPVTATRPTRENPQPVIAWPGWLWWYEDGILHAGRVTGEVRAHNFVALLNTIRKAEGGRGGGRDR